MAYTLWSRGVLLGRVTDMVPPGMPSPVPLGGGAGGGGGTIVGFFHATPDFHTRGAPLAEQAARGIDLAASARLAEKIRGAGLADATLSREEQGRRIQELVKGDPEAVRLAASHKAVMELGLELKTADGAVVPTGAIIVQPFPPSLPGMARLPLDKLRDTMKKEMAAAGLEVADLMLVAQPPAPGQH